jgi:hypothetical protein
MGWQVSGGGTRRWVLIETGANQAYIFDTNRLRHAVGASYLVHQLGTAWVRAAAAAHGAQVVLAISGKALLLVEDPAAGQAVIERVSAQALREAPGLEVTGAVGPTFDPALTWLPPAADSGHSDGGHSDGGHSDGILGPPTHVEALAGTYHLLDQVREARPSPHLRDPLLPWFEVCRDSGLPAAGNEQHADGEHAAAPVLAKSAQRHLGRTRMRDIFADIAHVLPDDLDELSNDGWIAVIHADGNGVGQVFTDFPARAWQVAKANDGDAGGLSLERHAELLAEFARQLDLATETALGIAVREATAGQPAAGRSAAGTILPVVVGGDDVTVVCDARFALPLARAFALHFEEQTAAQPTLAAIIAAGGAGPGDAGADSTVRPRTGPRLTAAAGIAYVKPHHPFSAAYALAEDLTASAKRVKQAGGHDVSAVDLYVAFESTLADLGDLRQRQAADDLPRHGGPYVITGQDSPAVGARDIAGLDRTMKTVSALSSSMAHDLREGLAAGRDEYGLRLRRAAQSPDLPAGVRPADIRYLRPDTGDETAGDGPIVRLLDALLLDAIARPSPGAAPADDTGPPAPGTSPHAPVGSGAPA